MYDEEGSAFAIYCAEKYIRFYWKYQCQANSFIRPHVHISVDPCDLKAKSQYHWEYTFKKKKKSSTTSQKWGNRYSSSNVRGFLCHDYRTRYFWALITVRVKPYQPGM